MLAEAANNADNKNDAANGADGNTGDGSATEATAAAATAIATIERVAATIAAIVRVAATTGGCDGAVTRKAGASEHAVLVILRAVRVGAADTPNDRVGETSRPAALITWVSPEEAAA